MPGDSEAYLEQFLLAAHESLVNIFNAAGERAERSGAAVQLVHLVLASLEDSAIAEILPHDVTQRLRSELSRQIFELPGGARVPGALGFGLSAMVDPARRLASAWGAPKISPLIFLATCLSPGVLPDESSRRTQEILRASGVTIESLSAATRPTDKQRRDYTYKSLGFGEDLTARARAGEWKDCPLIGMERELVTLVKMLGRGSACLVGEPGVGKTAFVEGLAWRIGTKDLELIPQRMHDWTIVMIQPAEIIAGMSAQGQLDERIHRMVSFFARNRTVIPFFDEIHRLLDTEDPTSKVVSTALKGPMARGLFRCVACTTDTEYARYIANDDAMKQRLRRFTLPEPDEATAVKIIAGSRANLLGGDAADAGVTISDDAIRAAVRVTSTHQRNERLPRKAIFLLNDAITEKVYQIDMARGAAVSKTVEATDVARMFSEVTRIPVEALDPSRPAYYESLIGQLRARVIGQDQAIRDLVSHLALHTRGWVNPRRPRGRFVFLGPPGVGKTELSLAVAAAEMRDPSSVIVLNMAEYQDESSVKKFMGADPGYIGFGQTSTLYSRVMMKPYSVVVLDEFEKCHPALANPLLSILDGSAADSQGRHVDFSHCVFFLTSNALIGDDIGAAAGLWDKVAEIDGVEDLAERATLIDKLDSELRWFLGRFGGIWTRPLLDRIDRICLFRPLTREALFGILGNYIAALREQTGGGLPDGLSDSEVLTQIIADATSGDTPASARRLERALLRWLTAHSDNQTAGV
jgi:ATP-dependent Clp protease ATP-binding subunit ClpC